MFKLPGKFIRGVLCVALLTAPLAHADRILLKNAGRLWFTFGGAGNAD